MNLTGFLRGYVDILFTDKNDGVFSTLRLLTRGHSSPRAAKLINFAASLLDTTECYMEIGTFTGFTMCAAGLESPRQCVGIDNFSEPYFDTANIEGELRSNLKRYVQNSMFLKGDFREHSADSIPLKCGVFYIDGKHTFEDVIDSVNWALPQLSDEAVLIFDDLNVKGVEEGVESALRDKRFEEVFRAKSFFDSSLSQGMKTDPLIHNGFSVIAYRGKSGHQ